MRSMVPKQYQALLFGHIWISKELGIILIAVIAPRLGTQWLLTAFRNNYSARARRNQSGFRLK
ncbi:hypothetical protein [Arthrobacter sp. ISL-30]|uniref:hypothetical protein n=1 Tax=Arthrobacter sp. ISL-30 TaxID=2819109 RepID=UPI001BEB7235|nr:hypothetical protein [Arthrobacter sp. ISL-30]MBT2512011.1 hypothetical protein [Arthrobacter sp. ISL-30]